MSVFFLFEARAVLREGGKEREGRGVRVVEEELKLDPINCSFLPV